MGKKALNGQPGKTTLWERFLLGVALILGLLIPLAGENHPPPQQVISLWKNKGGRVLLKQNFLFSNHWASPPALDYKLWIKPPCGTLSQCKKYPSEIVGKDTQREFYFRIGNPGWLLVIGETWSDHYMHPPISLQYFDNVSGKWKNFPCERTQGVRIYKHGENNSSWLAMFEPSQYPKTPCYVKQDTRFRLVILAPWSYDGRERFKAHGTVWVLFRKDTKSSPKINTQGKDLILWGKQTKGWGAKNAQITGNKLTLVTPARIFKVKGGAKGYCIWEAANPKNPVGRKVVCATNNATLIGFTLNPGTYTVIPEAGTYVTIYLNPLTGPIPGAKKGKITLPPLSWTPHIESRGRYEMNNERLCAHSMNPGGAWFTVKRPYALNRDYTVEFEFKLNTSDNHYPILYSDGFVFVAIGWGTKLQHYQPGAPYNLKDLNDLQAGKWYKIRIEAHPSQGSFSLYLNGQLISTARNIKILHPYHTLSPQIKDSGNIWIGDPDSVEYRGGTYNRGDVCWRNISVRLF